MGVRWSPLLVQLAAIVVLCIGVEVQNNSSINSTTTTNSSSPSNSNTTSLLVTSTPDKTTSKLPNITILSTSSAVKVTHTSEKIASTIHPTAGVQATLTMSTADTSTHDILINITNTILNPSSTIQLTSAVYSTSQPDVLPSSSTTTSIPHNPSASIVSISFNITSSSNSTSSLTTMPPPTSTSPAPGNTTTSSIGISSTTVVMPTVMPSWTNWTTVKNCKKICRAAGGTVTQLRACTRGSITLTSAVPCNGNHSQVVRCSEGCPDYLSGSTAIVVNSFVAVGGVVLGLVIKMLYAG